MLRGDSDIDDRSTPASSTVHCAVAASVDDTCPNSANIALMFIVSPDMYDDDTVTIGDDADVTTTVALVDEERLLSNTTRRNTTLRPDGNDDGA